MSIVYIGKETPIRKLIELTFTDSGHDFYSYNSLSDCELVIKELFPSLVLMDLDNGIEWPQLDKSLEGAATQIPVVGIGENDSRPSSEFVSFHYLKTILKPINPSLFLEEVDKILKRKS